ncbi:MAG: hypothetical protein L3K25_06265 [Gammaproteobacteria bacterium]|nr:hypothetical protein [Gammaproteobacteria bacterium]
MINNKIRSRLQFLSRVVEKERDHLLVTDQRLFSQPFDIDRVKQMGTDVDLAERVEAFVGRFGRLQDTLGDKLLPTLFIALGERSGAFIDNLDRAEKLEFIDSADEWMGIRNLRNQMVHEYIEDPVILLSALQAGHNYVPNLEQTANNMLNEIRQRSRGID